MNIELPSFNAFALESCGTAGQVAGAANTLTLGLELAPVHPLLEPMVGTLSLAGAAEPTLLPLCACVVPACSDPLTITFVA